MTQNGGGLSLKNTIQQCIECMGVFSLFDSDSHYYMCVYIYI